jgi:hypothetical protein
MVFLFAVDQLRDLPGQLGGALADALLQVAIQRLDLGLGALAVGDVGER